MCEICSKLAIKTPDFKHCSSVSIVDLGQVTSSWVGQCISQVPLQYLKKCYESLLLFQGHFKVLWNKISASIYLFKANSRNTIKRCEIC